MEVTVKKRLHGRSLTPWGQNGSYRGDNQYDNDTQHDDKSTISIMTPRIMTLNIMTLSRMAVRIITLSIMTLNITTFTITLHNIMKLSIKTPSLTTLCKTVLSVIKQIINILNVTVKPIMLNDVMLCLGSKQFCCVSLGSIIIVTANRIISFFNVLMPKLLNSLDNKVEL